MGNEKEKVKPIKILEAVVKDDKKLKIIVIAGLLLVGLLFLSSLFPQKTVTEKSAAMQTITMEEYANTIEQKVLEMTKSMEGVGNAKVMVTLENGKETLYQQNTKKQTDTQGNAQTGQSANENIEQEVVLIDGGNGTKQALIKTEKAPTVKGIVVVCDGAGDVQVKARIIDCLKAAFGISSARIAVVQHN